MVVDSGAQIQAPREEESGAANGDWRRGKLRKDRRWEMGRGVEKGDRKRKDGHSASFYFS